VRRSLLQLQINPLGPGDVEPMKALLENTLQDFAECGSVLSSAIRRTKSLEKVYRGVGSQYLVAKIPDGTIAAGVGVGPLAGLPPSEQIGEIRELVVTPSYRGYGFGTQLLESALAEAVKLGYRRLYLETTPEMIHAQRLFQRHGFRPVRETPQSTVGRDAVDAMPAYYLIESLTPTEGAAAVELDDSEIFV
jgi:putative acetyltransferase